MIEPEKSAAASKPELEIVSGPAPSGASPSNPQQPKNKRSWLAITLPVAFISAFAELGLGIMNNSALPVYFKQGLQLDTVIYTTVMTPFFISEVLFKSPLGLLADKFGRKPLMVIGPAISIFTPLVLAATVYPVGHVVPVLLVLFGFLRLLDGLGAAALWPAMFAYIGDHVEEENRTSAMSLLNVMYIMGLAFGFLAGGWVNDTFGPVLSGKATLGYQMHGVYSNFRHNMHNRIHEHGHHFHGLTIHPSHVGLGPYNFTIDAPAQYHPSFYLASILFAIATIVALIALRDRATDRKLGVEEHHDVHAATEKVTWQTFIDTVKIVPHLMLIAVVTFLGIGSIALLIKIFALDELGVTETDFGLLVLWPAVIIGALAVPLGHLSDKFGKVQSVRGGFLIAAVGMWTIVLLFPSAHLRDIGLIFGGSLLGIGFVIAFPAWMALLTCMGAESQRATIVGAVSTAQGIGMFLGAFLGGWLYSHASSDVHVAHIAPFAASAVLLTISAALTILLIKSGTGAMKRQQMPISGDCT